MSTYVEIKKWFLDSLKELKKEFYILIKKVASKNGMEAEDVFLILQNQNLWPILSNDLYRALTLAQEIVLWTQVPSVKPREFDVSKIPSVVYEIAMTLNLKIFPSLEASLDSFIDQLSIERKESYLSILENFERGLSKDRFVLREIILGIISSQFKTLKF